jgi:hypothetical protein
VVITELGRRLSTSQDLFDQHDTSAAPTAKVQALDAAAKTLLNEDFRIFPEFNLTGAQGDEIENALAASVSLNLFRYLTTPAPGRDPSTFP